MWSYNYNPKYLEHHGILGQKWGKRNGPPYPLGSGDHSVSEKKADWRKSLDNNGKQEYNKKHKRGSDAVSKGRRFAEKFMSKHGSLPAGMSETAILAVSYLAMTAAMAAVPIASYVAEKNRYSRELTHSLFNNRKINSLDEAPRMQSKMHPSNSMKVTNPYFPDEGAKINCTFCTAAMAMREKGFDVVASKTNHVWYSSDLYKKTFDSKSVAMNKRQSPDKMLKTLSSMGDGAYGNLSIVWRGFNAGHSIFWKNENGKTRFYDGQNGKEYDAKDPNHSSFISSIRLDNVMYNRLDNCEPTKFVLGIIEPRHEGGNKS